MIERPSSFSAQAPTGTEAVPGETVDRRSLPARPVPVIEATNLTRHFPVGRGRTVHALDGVNLAVREREIVGLVGESGSGKSTFGKTLIGLHDKTDGTVHYRGELLPARYRPRDFRRLAPHIQMIFQDPYSSLNPRMTVGEIIGEGLRLPGLRADREGRSTPERVALWLGRVGLDPAHASRYPHEFSGGQRQRIGIARALILEPDFVVCDEPISALDVSVQAQIVGLLGELQADLGLSLLFIAHDLSMVRYLCDRMAVMYLGTLVETGPAKTVYADPLHPYTQALIASNPEPDPIVARQRRGEPPSGDIPSPIDIPTGCRFAPRCPRATPDCHQHPPILRSLAKDPDRAVACHLVD